MKMKLFAVTIALFLSGLNLSFASLSLAPENPEPSSAVEVHYKNDFGFAPSSKLYLFVYYFNSKESIPDAFQIELKKAEGKNYHATLTVPSDAVFAMLKVGDLNTFDTKYHAFWDFLVFGRDGRPMKDANLKAALSYMGNFPPNILRNTNFDKAQNYLTKESELYPLNIVATIGLVSLELDLKKIKKEEFGDKIHSIVSDASITDDENAIIAVARALRTIKENDKADELEESFSKWHPQSKITQERKLNELSEAGTFSAFKWQAQEFLKTFPNSPSLEKVWLALMKAYIADDKLDDFKKLTETSQNVPSAVYVQMASMTMDKKTYDTKKVDSEVQNFFSKAEEAIKSDNENSRPSYFADSEWQEMKSQRLAKLYTVIADALYDDKLFGEALEYLQKAKSILRSDADFNIYDSMIDNQLQLNNHEGAFLTAKEAIGNSSTSTFIDSVFKEFYYKFTTSSKNYENCLDSLTEAGNEKRLNDLNDDLLNIPAKFETVLSADGEKIQPDFFKNKVLVVCFWASWCEPCKESMQPLETLYNLYKDNPDVMVIAVNVWENAKKRKAEVQKFINENKINIPVYVDGPNRLPNDFGFSGLPARIFLDKSGIIRFKDLGFDGAEKLIRDSEDKIEYLLNKMKDKND